MKLARLRKGEHRLMVDGILVRGRVNMTEAEFAALLGEYKRDPSAIMGIDVKRGVIVKNDCEGVNA